MMEKNHVQEETAAELKNSIRPDSALRNVRMLKTGGRSSLEPCAGRDCCGTQKQQQSGRHTDEFSDA